MHVLDESNNAGCELYDFVCEVERLQYISLLL